MIRSVSSSKGDQKNFTRKATSELSVEGEVGSGKGCRQREKDEKCHIEVRGDVLWRNHKSSVAHYG